MAGKFGTPQNRGRIRHLLLRAAAVPIERYGALIQPHRLGPIPGKQFAQREMPA
jgi:hypothetical protein